MTHATVRTDLPPRDGPAPSNVAAAPRQWIASVVSRMQFTARRQAVWDGLVFYEQIHRRPPLLLRLLLPVPIRTVGSKSRVGDEVVCYYRGGYLLKRVTRIQQGRSYEFDVLEQTFKIGGGIALLGGSYTLHDLPEERTEVALATRYASRHRPRWLCGRIEALVCHSFHRHILGWIRDNLASR